MSSRIKADKKGFTLVEIIVVLVVIAILAAIIIPGLVGFIDKAAIKADIASLGTLNRATQLHTISSGMIGQDVFKNVVLGSNTDLNEARMQHLVDNGALDNIIKAKHAKNKFVWSSSRKVWYIQNLDNPDLDLTQEDAESKGFTFSNGKITGYTGSSKDVTIPSRIDGVDVTEIGGSVFESKGLTSVALPDSVTKIGANAFKGNKLTSLIMPDSVTELGDGVFSNNELESLTLSSSLKMIKQWAFDNNKLKTVTIPDGVGILEYAAFRKNELTEVVLGNVGTIGNMAFEGNQLTSIDFPSSVKVIGTKAFENNQLEEIIIPNTVRYIWPEVFKNNKITSIDIQGKPEKILGGAFNGNGPNGDKDITITTEDCPIKYMIDETSGEWEEQ